MRNILSNNKNFYVCFACIITFFLKNVLFQAIVWQLIPFSTLYKQPFEFFLFYMPKLLPAIFVSSFIFLFKRNYWTIVVQIVFDLWIITNLIYYRANGFFIGVEEILISNNMRGFGESILLYFSFSFLIIPFLTIFYSILIVFIYKRNGQFNRDYFLFFAFLLLCILLAPHRLLNDKRIIQAYRPLSENETYSFFKVMNPLYGPRDYINVRRSVNLPYAMNVVVYSSYSIMAYLPMTIGDYVFQKIEVKNIEPLQEEDIFQFINKKKSHVCSKHRVLFLLVESLESWPINNDGIDGKEVCPNLVQLIEGENVVYCPFVKSQVRQGTSGDGQMISITGLLPIQVGSACMLYPNNVYPSVVKMFPSSIVVNPCPYVWNQHIMNERYGFTDNCIPNEKTKESWEDKEVLDNVYRVLHNYNFVLGLTISMHGPFKIGESNFLQLPSEMPDKLNHYLNAFHYFDKCLGNLLEKIESDTTLRDLTIVITGDHTVFKDNMMKEFQPYVIQKHLPIPTKEGYVPLIIKSPLVEQSTTIMDTLYQMDIYPTILNLINCQDYYWKGFGIDILDDSSRHNRPILEHDAYILSDRLIKTNYFQSHSSDLE